MLPIRPVRGIKRYEEHIDLYRYSRERRSRKDPGSSSGGMKPGASFPYAKEAEPHAIEAFARAIAAVLGSASELKGVLEAFDEARSSSVLRKRIVHSSQPEAVTAKAEPGSRLQTVYLEIRRIAMTQLNRTALFAPGAPTTVEQGVYRLRVSCGETTHTLELWVHSEDTHRTVLRRLCTVVNQAEAGISAKLETDPAAGRIRLNLESTQSGADHAFRLEDATGNLAGAMGLLIKDRTAADAEYRLNGGAWSSSPSNRFPLKETGLQLELHGPSNGRAALRILPDFRYMAQMLQRLEHSVSALEAELRQASEYMNPAFAQSLASITGSIGLAGLSEGLEDRYETIAGLLTGPDGLVAKLWRLIARMEAGPAENLLNRSNTRYKRYANYLSTLDWYSQLPNQGWLLNRFF